MSKLISTDDKCVAGEEPTDCTGRNQGGEGRWLKGGRWKKNPNRKIGLAELIVWHLGGCGGGGEVWLLAYWKTASYYQK